MTMTEQAVGCPKCGGAMWDNRTTKKNPAQPDFKCKNKPACDGVIWPPKPNSRPAAPAAPTARQPISAGGYVPGLDPAPAPAGAGAVPDVRITTVYGECLRYVLEYAVPAMMERGIEADASAVAAMTATLFIQRNQRGI